MEKNNKLFLKKCIIVLSVMYILTTWALSRRYIWVNRDEYNDYGGWRRFWYQCMPMFFTVAACYFYVMEAKIRYFIAELCVFGLGWGYVLDKTLYSKHITKEIVFHGFLLAIILMMPLVNKYCHSKRIHYVVFASLGISIGDLIRIYCERYTSSEGYFWMMRTAILFCALAVAWDVLWCKEVNVERIFANIVFIFMVKTGCRIISVWADELRLIRNPWLRGTPLGGSVYWNIGCFVFTIEIILLISILLTFLICYVFPAVVPKTYLCCLYALIIWKNVIFYKDRKFLYPYSSMFTFAWIDVEIIGALLFATVYVFWIKNRKKEISFGNSILWILLIYSMPYLGYAMRVLRNYTEYIWGNIMIG